MGCILSTGIGVFILITSKRLGGGADGVPIGVWAGDKVAEAAKMAAMEMLENVFANFMIVVVRV
tara:strand:+ start:610 stop:801 length:192 start_codon:yes stop_codon:yes gene_type:complete